MTKPSDQASTSSLTLPSRKTFITALSSVAFVSGIGVATVVTLRRGRRMRQEELQSAASASHKPGTSNLPPSLRTRDDNLPPSTSNQSPLTLFKEMNRAAFGRKQDYPQAETPSALLRQRGKQVKSSVFDSSASAGAPSALMRATPKATSKEIAIQQTTERREKQQHNTIDQSVPLDQTETMVESPVLMAVKAIGIATALVGTGALIAWEIARRVLGVQNVDELIDRLATAVPSRAKDQDTLSDVGQAARKSLRGRLNDEEWEEEMARQVVTSDGKPLSLDEALQALDDAAGKGEAATWVSVLSRQLDAEREQDLEERRQRIARRRGAVQEQMSV